MSASSGKSCARATAPKRSSIRKLWPVCSRSFAVPVSKEQRRSHWRWESDWSTSPDATLNCVPIDQLIHGFCLGGRHGLRALDRAQKQRQMLLAILCPRLKPQQIQEAMVKEQRDIVDRQRLARIAPTQGH